MNDWLKNKWEKGKNNGQILKRIIWLRRKMNKQIYEKVFQKDMIGWNFCETRQVMGKIWTKKDGKIKIHVFLAKISEFVAGEELNTVWKRRKTGNFFKKS